jgi:hypothetical protein
MKFLRMVKRNVSSNMTIGKFIQLILAEMIERYCTTYNVSPTYGLVWLGNWMYDDVITSLD